MLFKRLIILTEEYYWNAFKTYKYFHRIGLLEFFPNMWVFSQERIIRMLSKHGRILIDVGYSNAIIQTYKYSHRRGLFECFPDI